MSVVLSAIAVIISLWVAWLTYFHRRPKASLRINSSGTGMILGEDGLSERMEDHWDISISNVGKVPLVVMNLVITKTVEVSVNDEAVGEAELHVSREEIPPTSIGVEEVKTFRLTQERPDNVDDSHDPNVGKSVSGALMSSRGTASLNLSVDDLIKPVVVKKFR